MSFRRSFAGRSEPIHIGFRFQPQGRPSRADPVMLPIDNAMDWALGLFSRRRRERRHGQNYRVTETVTETSSVSPRSRRHGIDQQQQQTAKFNAQDPPSSRVQRFSDDQPTSTAPRSGLHTGRYRDEEYERLPHVRNHRFNWSVAGETYWTCSDDEEEEEARPSQPHRRSSMLRNHNPSSRLEASREGDNGARSSGRRSVHEGHEDRSRHEQGRRPASGGYIAPYVSEPLDESSSNH